MLRFPVLASQLLNIQGARQWRRSHDHHPSPPAGCVGCGAGCPGGARPRGRPPARAAGSGGRADLSTPIEAYVALRLAGDLPDPRHMAIAAAWIRAEGGLAAGRVFTRIWLALFGQWSWDSLPGMPPEMIYLPAWFP